MWWWQRRGYYAFVGLRHSSLGVRRRKKKGGKLSRDIKNQQLG